MAVKTKKRKPRTKERQGYLPGTEPPRIKAIDDAAETYYDVMMDRTKLSKEEHEAMDNLVEKMKEHGTDRYETPEGLVVTAISKTKCSVKRKKDEPSTNGDGEHAEES